MLHDEIENKFKTKQDAYHAGWIDAMDLATDCVRGGPSPWQRLKNWWHSKSPKEAPITPFDEDIP